MKLDIEKIPFTRYGSYMVVSYMKKDFRLFGQDLHLTDGLYLRSLRGDTMMNPVAYKLVPTLNGKQAEYEYEANESHLKIRLENGTIRIAFADRRTLLIEGVGEGIGLSLEDIDKGGVFDFLHEIFWQDKRYYEINLYKNQNKYLCAVQEGTVKMDQVWEEKTASSCKIEFREEQGRFLAVIEEEKREWSHREFRFDMEEVISAAVQELAAFTEKLPTVQEQHESLRNLAGYIMWCNTVQKEGFLTRDAMYASNNWMLGAFSWDQCFPAMALAYKNPKLAWDQLMIMFDYQDGSGRIPDYVTDTDGHWNYSKPPIHGWTLLRMMEEMELTEEQKEEAYVKLGKWTKWWYEYRDGDQDGVCEYFHGNDSGWDNATPFRMAPTIESPELSAYLAIQEEALAELAKDLGKTDEEAEWKKRAEKQIKDMLSHSYYKNKPHVMITRIHEEVENDSLLPYQMLLLGKSLPEEVRLQLIKNLKEGQFFTEYGIATESLQSEFYHEDGYWRGPIWAPSTVIMLDALWQAGEEELVHGLAEKFVKLVEKSGFAENFDALTGEGRRDRAYTWTAAGFLIIAHKYL